MRAWPLAVSVLAVWPIRLAVAAPPPELGPRGAAIVGGTEAQACAWPSVVALQGGGLCTGTLVHPRVVVYAAHCGTFATKVGFGERIDAPTREVDTLICERFSDLFAVSSMDYAYCLLAEPVEDLPITPALFGCDEDLIAIGTPVTIVGFGDTTVEPPEQVGIKHEATTQIVGYLSMVVIGGMGVGADTGDSGGPAFVELDGGSWRLLGIVSGGGGDGAAVQYVPAPVTIAWIEDRTGVDITPCHAPDGSWAPTPDCEGFFVAPEPGAQWAASCPSATSPASDRCGPPWTELADVDPPSVAFVDPVDGEQLPGPPIALAVLAEADDGAGVGVAEVRLRVDDSAWFDDLGRPGIDQVAPYRFEGVTLTEAGAHRLELEAVDHFGNTATAEATIVVGEDPGETGDDTGDDTTGTETDTGAGTGAPPGDDEARGSCVCSHTDGSPSSAWIGLLALVSLARRRANR